MSIFAPLQINDFHFLGFEKFQGTPKGDEISRKYNLHIENATLVYAILEQWRNGPSYFMDIIRRHFWLKRQAVLAQAEKWLQDMAEDIKNSTAGGQQSREEMDGMVEGIFSNPTVQVSQNMGFQQSNCDECASQQNIHSASSLTHSTPICHIQRQNVRKLIEEFRDMPNPLLDDCCDDGDGDEDGACDMEQRE